MSALAMAGWRFYLRQPGQLLLCLMSIALGVAVVVAMDVVIDSARRGFQLSTESVFGTATHSLDAGQAGFDEQLYHALRTGLRRIPSAPVVEGSATYRLNDDEQLSLGLLGIDPFAESVFRAYGMNSSGTAQSDTSWSSLVSEPGTLLASEETLRGLKAVNGDWINIQVAGRQRRVRIVGVIRAHNNLQRRGLENVLVADIATAQELLDFNGRLSRVDLILSESAAGRGHQAALEAMLPDTVRLRQRQARAQAKMQLTRSFFLNLRMLSMLALVVGLFIVYSAMTFSVVRRREWIGFLRAVGVTAHGIVLMVVFEALVLGVVGTALGAIMGAGLAQWLLELVTRSLNDLYFSSQVSALELSLKSLPVVLVTGVAGSVFAALGPALEAVCITPRAAMLRSALERRIKRLGAIAALSGLGMFMLIPVLLWWQPRSLMAGYGALMMAVIGFACLTPHAIRVFSSALRSLPGIERMPLFSIALGGIHQGLSRNAMAVTALMIALAASVGVNVMVDSFRQTLDGWLNTTLKADIYLAVDSRQRADVIDPELLRAIARIPGIATITTSLDLEIISDQGDVWLKVLDVQAPQPYRGLSFKNLQQDQAWRSLAQPRAVSISESFAWRHRLEVGGRIDITTPSGPRPFTIVAIFRDYGSERGLVIMDEQNFRQHWHNGSISDLGLYLYPEQSLQPVLAAIKRLTVNNQALRMLASRDIRALSLEIFDQTFAVTEVLKWLAILVAVGGILSALMALQLEQQRQMAVLRAQGLTRGELFVIQELQTGCLGLLAGLLAMPLGLILSGLLIHVINQRAFGWSLDYYLAPEIFIHSVMLAVAAALVAGLYPAWNLAHQTPAAAMRGL